MQETRTTLHELPSGKIEIVDNGIITRIQFNTTCEDAMPYCKGMCCRMRNLNGTILKEDEVDKFQNVPHPSHPDLKILATKPENSCVYQLEETRLCTVHQDKPKNCQVWHCSPEGKGEGITQRDLGWLMLITLGNLGDSKSV